MIEFPLEPEYVYKDHSRPYNKINFKKMRCRTTGEEHVIIKSGADDGKYLVFREKGLRVKEEISYYKLKKYYQHT